MPLYDYRLEAQDGSGEFRVGHVWGDTKEKARARLVLLEERAVEYTLSDEDLARAKAGDPELGNAKGKLAVHNQSEPYKIVRLEPAKKKG